MDEVFRKETLRIGGMTCVNCQNKIERKLKDTEGIRDIRVSYNDGTAVVTYDTSLISLDGIKNIIAKLDYEVLGKGSGATTKEQVFAIVLFMSCVYMLLRMMGVTQLFRMFPVVRTRTGYKVLFLIGVFTSVHCIAMCGGINLSQCIGGTGENRTGGKTSSLLPSLLYNAGRIISYTVVGAIVGAIGSVVEFPGAFKGIVQIIAGIFMVIMGINLLGLFTGLRRFNLRLPRFFSHKIEGTKKKSKSPLIVGLLNGLMPCGPLQAMQLYALSAGSAVEGGLSMLAFSLGTVPLMFGLGALSTFLSRKSADKILKFGAVLVIFLGISMLSDGWALSGLKIPYLSAYIAKVNADGERKPAVTTVTVEDGVQIVKSELRKWERYPSITVKKGLPVKWTIDVELGALNGCNERIVIPDYGIEHAFTVGENTIEFTPDKAGRITYSCWMGMLRGYITVEN
jgi:sulfite exporter TauE/SafE/copper chaperone CopZ